MHTVTIFSGRIYEDETGVDAGKLDNTIKQFNRILYGVYNLILLSMTEKEKYKNILDGKSLHLYVKGKYHLDDYYANSIIRLAKGRVDSQKKLNKEYKKQKECSLKEVKDKLKDVETRLKDLETLRDSFLKYREDGCKGGLKKKGIKNISICGDIIEVKYMKKGKLYTDVYNPYSFEYEYLNWKINHLRNLISKYQYRINILQERIKNLDKIKHSIFGTKKLMKEYTKCADEKDKKKLKDMITYKKYRTFSISGRKDAKCGNFVFKPVYHPDNDTFDISVRMTNKETAIFKDVSFPYRHEEFLKALDSKTPVCFGVIKRIKNGRTYYLISAGFGLEAVKRINTDVSTGCVGIDFNYGHIDVSDIDEKGNLVNSFTVYYNTGYGSRENELSLRKALNEAAEYVARVHKIVVIEALDLETAKFKANRDKPKHKGMNRMMHSFPYEKYNTIIHQTGMKHEFLVKEVNPAFTSIIGKLKYAGDMKLSTHIAASYVIARRGLGFKERLLREQREFIHKKDYGHKSEWKKWSYVNKNTCQVQG